MNDASEALFRAGFLIFAVAALAVGGALVFEHGFGYLPCMLCLWQRWPYYLGAPLALVAALLAWSGHDGAARLLLVIVGLMFLGGAGLGAYHAGVEWGFWPGPTSCAGANAAPTSAGGLLDQMRTTRIVPCDAAAWRLFGISLAGYNALIAAGLTAVAFAAVRRR
ncbi:disulfide bond formation protein B [Hansschlegelia zhihuaiae]|uniref:Disulfide bond formation protein B n=1 Tax=Hansschlegelia zhihuaiae TaxID=405005 RepID=A0A4Q0MK10_9HYPH|nr:disulfide bond formation protein B [Hansschlegelia zhihuaiae]RXF73753.1 disulfide bond formation protein B [Hansschlegelia zhihuaiae]